jgi:hypothetical protein
MERQTLTSHAGGHISPDTACAKFCARRVLSVCALCANEHVMVTECKSPTNKTYIHTRHEIFSADTNDCKLFSPFSDPQERCTQTGAETRVWGRSCAHAMLDRPVFTRCCCYTSLLQQLMKPTYRYAHFELGCLLRAVTPAMHSAQNQAQAGTAEPQSAGRFLDTHTHQPVMRNVLYAMDRADPAPALHLHA